MRVWLSARLAMDTPFVGFANIQRGPASCATLPHDCYTPLDFLCVSQNLHAGRWIHKSFSFLVITTILSQQTETYRFAFSVLRRCFLSLRMCIRMASNGAQTVASQHLKSQLTFDTATMAGRNELCCLGAATAATLDVCCAAATTGSGALRTRTCSRSIFSSPGFVSVHRMGHRCRVFGRSPGMTVPRGRWLLFALARAPSSPLHNQSGTQPRPLLKVYSGLAS
jgi:hypothetical protein